MDKNISFTDKTGLHLEYSPQPASSYIPEWYKKMDSYTNKTGVPTDTGATGTIKKCMPVFDSINAGYIITTFVDIWVKYIPGQPSYYTWRDFEPVRFHRNAQVSTHFSNNKFDFPKLVNPWCIKTPQGYSTLFLPPMHRDNPISIFPAVVDTDKYTLNVEFPFMLTNLEFDGLIPAGTPIAQVIPFKRDNWKMNISEGDTKENINIGLSLRSKFYNVYKDKYRSKKQYK